MAGRFALRDTRRDHPVIPTRPRSASLCPGSQARGHNTGFFRKARSLHLGYSTVMTSQDDDAPDDATCDTCGGKLTLVASLPKIGSRSRRRLYKCVHCQMVITIPPSD